MGGPKPDCSGWATKYNLLCADGKTILDDAFAHQGVSGPEAIGNGQFQVPLVYQHDHDDIENVLGHAIMTPKPEGVWADVYFNDTPKAQHGKAAVKHKDLRHFSVWANKLTQRASQVFKGHIKELSLVLGGANPGAVIQDVYLEHGDGSRDRLDGEAIIYTGIEWLAHSDDEGEGEDRTINEVYESLDADQKELLHWMVGQAAQGDEPLQQDDMGDDPENLGDEDDSETENPGDNPDSTEAGDGQEGTTVSGTDANDVIKHNIFETRVHADGKKSTGLTEAAMKGILAHAEICGSMKTAVHAFVEQNGDTLSHGIENLEILFPEARAMTQTPTWDKRRTEWVSVVLGGVRHIPWTRIKTWTADITYDEARAKGYIKGNMKKEEFFSVAKRETGPTTFYKKQKFDRDDIIDITDFDLITWVKGEMRMMLEEEFARAILLGDGREVDHDDKIPEDKIRPIANDDPYYTIQVNVDSTDARTVADTILVEMEQYKGKGSPIFFCKPGFLNRALVQRSELTGERIWKTAADLAAEMNVSRIVPVEVMTEYDGLIGVVANLGDYGVGTDKGGEVTLFDDFDLDFNQYKYLIEGRSSGALLDPKTAMVIKEEAANAVTAGAPTIDRETYIITVPGTEHVEYRNGATGAVIKAAASDDAVTVELDPGDVLRIVAYPAATYFLNNGRREWSFLCPSDFVATP
jgi:hypothetical protein